MVGDCPKMLATVRVVVRQILEVQRLRFEVELDLPLLLLLLLWLMMMAMLRKTLIQRMGGRIGNGTDIDGDGG